MNWLIAQGRYLFRVLAELMRLADYDAEVQLQSLNRVPIIAQTIARLADQDARDEADAAATRAAPRVLVPLAVRLTVAAGQNWGHVRGRE